MKKAILASAVSAILLAGCGGGGGGDGFSVGADKSEDSPICATGLECQQLEVPASYINDDGSKVKVFYAIHKATDTNNRIGTLFVNFGGPGQEAQASLAWMVNAGLFDQAIVERFDIVALDPRGSGQSAYAKELKQCAVELANNVNACDEFNTKSAVNISTNTLVKDIDALRAHLGEEQISFLGYSYGTRVGSVYADLFPERIRALVLDSPMSPKRGNFVEMNLDNAKGYDVVASYRLGTPERKQALDQGVTSLFNNGAIYGNDGELDLVTGVNAIFALRTKDSEGYWDHQKAGVFELLDNGKVSLLNRLVASTNWYQADDQADAARTNAMFKSVVCADESTPLTFAEANTYEPDFAQASAVYGLRNFYSEANMCMNWVGERDPMATVTEMDAKLQQPVLILGGQYDPRTPYIWTEAMSESFASLTRLIRVENIVEHGFSYRGNRCIDNASTAYLLDPSSASNELVCDGSTLARSAGNTALKPHPVMLNQHF
ncbi:alpha/beta fold hydrolase [Motilimonas sp. 1_MG-2023]|uniref:alpha/beta fold hydrolase n=1 Tax=Motilimonas sp. 1_MG-2023 TaxID=3062672 RepID=UPI0026E364F5|nr:alpha/beta fold hydrolase [Motilimonas sp. 1_MG-2023]